MSEPKLKGPRNALEWFHQEYCKYCRPKKMCDPEMETRCLLANILFELENFFGWMAQSEKEAKKAVEEAEEILKLRKSDKV